MKKFRKTQHIGSPCPKCESDANVWAIAQGIYRCDTCGFKSEKKYFQGCPFNQDLPHWNDGVLWMLLNQSDIDFYGDYYLAHCINTDTVRECLDKFIKEFVACQKSYRQKLLESDAMSAGEYATHVETCQRSFVSEFLKLLKKYFGKDVEQ